MYKTLKRSSTNQSIVGVCGGIGEFFGISPLAVRLIFIILLPVSMLAYLILANTMSIDGSKIKGYK
ncbi:PspC domain-containing protein [Bacillus weihaiensis]|uniref:PspC domain-containing protein n=1 Tax=Bacillus weihaiensis TaxID=1547283 RepID=UPI002352FF6A|nr:PspC domain-containing protein [Bacillus weihaiensis]